MITLSEISALIELASRAPKSQAEVLWLQALIQKIEEQRKHLQQTAQNRDVPEDGIAG